MNKDSNKDSIQGHKNNLEIERRRLLLEIAQHEKPAYFGSDTEDPDEETDKSEDFSNRLSIAQDLKNRLGEIDVALSRIQSGGYGVCEKCGKPISKEILDSDPASRFCEDCRSES